ncbi:MAG: hypothetical protein R2883_06485 [Caldisericia bacterium]
MEYNLEEYVCHLMQGSDQSMAIPHLMKLSVKLLNDSRLSKGIEYARLAKDLAVKSGIISFIIDSAINYSNLVMLEGDIESARTVLYGTYRAMTQAGADVFSEVKLLIAIANFETRFGKVSESENQIRRAYYKLGRNIDNSTLVRLHILESMNNFHINMETAISHADRAFELAKKNPTSILKCGALRNKMVISSFLGNFSDSKDILDEIKRHPRTGDGQIECDLETAIREIELAIESGEYVLAEELISKYRDFAKKIGSRIHIACSLYLKSFNLLQKGRLNLSLNFSFDALELARKIGYNRLIGKILVNIGWIYVFQDKILKTRNVIEECRDFDRKVDEIFKTEGLKNLDGWCSLFDGNHKRVAEIIQKINEPDAIFKRVDIFDSRILKSVLLLRNGELKSSLREVQEIKKEFDALIQYPVYSCELMLLEADLGLAMLDGFFKKMKSKRNSKTFFPGLA